MGFGGSSSGAIVSLRNNRALIRNKIKDYKNRTKEARGKSYEPIDSDKSFVAKPYSPEEYLIMKEKIRGDIRRESYIRIIKTFTVIVLLSLMLISFFQ